MFQSVIFTVTHQPVIETCRLGIEDEMGNVFNTTFIGNTTSCDNTIDTYVNIIPKELSIVFDLAFRLPKDPPSGEDRHKYVEDFHFGVVDGDVSLFLYQKSTNWGNVVNV